MLQYVKTVL